MALHKRSHKTLNLSEKSKILDYLDKGMSVRAVALEFKIPKSTVYDIKKKKTEIKNYISNTFHCIGKRKVLKGGEHPEVEKLLYSWFMKQRAQHIPISSDILREKAKQLYKNVTGKTDFLASSGWLDKFKARHGIRYLKVCGESVSNNASAVKPFQDYIAKQIMEMELSKEQVYNCDESACFWRALPNTTWVHKEEKSAPGRKISKDRITFMPCTNAAGTHKLPLLVLGKAAKPRCFKTAKLPVKYMASKNGWMSKKIFKNWFEENFVPEVTKFLKSINRPLKALLIIDNAPSHPKEEEIVINDNFKILFLPANCTALLQPLDQNVIQNIKVCYRKKLLNFLINQESIDIVHQLKIFNLKNAVDFLAQAWNSISRTNIESSWNNLLNKTAEWVEEDEIPISELQQRYIRNSSVTDLEEIQNIFENVIKDPSLTNHEIIEWAYGVSEGFISELTHENFTEGTSSPSLSEISLSEDTVVSKIKDQDAIRSLEVLMQWAEENELEDHKVLLLKNLQKEIELKLQAKPKQTTISSFFKSMPNMNP